MRKIILFLKKLFSKSRLLIEKAVKPSIAVVEALKALLDSPAVPLITAIIPGNIDDVLAARIKNFLPVILKMLGYADECINAKTGDAILQCALAKLRSANDPQKHAAWHNIASNLSMYLSDGKLTWSEAIHLAEMVYNDTKAK